jgi:hypothetical protein
MSTTDLQAEVERLRTEVESYKQRELADLRAALASALSDVAHYRNEAQRNADIGREIHATAQEEIARLRSQIEVKEQVQLQLRRQGANATRN